MNIFCQECRLSKPVADFGDPVLVASGFIKKCISCRETHYSRKTKKVQRDENGKSCSKCGLYKPFSDFYTKKTKSVDGCTSQCKECIRSHTSEYRRRPETIAREQSPEHKEAEREYSREWSKRNAVKKRGYSAKFRIAHPKYWTYQIWLAKQDNPKAFRAKIARYSHIRRARVKGAGGSYTLQEWQALCDSLGNKCVACGKKRKLTVDHITPITQGGSNNIDNLQPLCARCNSAKGARHSTNYILLNQQGISE